MEKELKVIPPIGYEIDRQKSTLEKIIFKKIPENPKTWEEYCKLNSLKDSFTVVYDNCSAECSHTGYYSEFSTEERTKQFIAFGKLLQLRDYWVRGYSEFKYAVYGDRLDGTAICDWCKNTHYPLTFPTKEMAHDFKNCFSDLINKAYPLV